MIKNIPSAPNDPTANNPVKFSMFCLVGIIVPYSPNVLICDAQPVQYKHAYFTIAPLKLNKVKKGSAVEHS